MVELSETDRQWCHECLTLIASTEDPGASLAGTWTLLQESESLMVALVDGDQPPESTPGNIDVGPALYLLNHLPEPLVGLLRGR